MGQAHSRRAAIVASLLGSVLVSGACGSSSPMNPTLPGLTLTVPASVTGHVVTCDGCETPRVVVAEFSVTVGDPLGPGGTLQRVDVVATDTTRGSEVGRNTRPNESVSYPDTVVPKAGALTVPAGVVISPAPAADDTLTLSIAARLEDGRATTRSVPLIVDASPQTRR